VTLDEFFCENNRSILLDNCRHNQEDSSNILLQEILEHVKTIESIRFAIFFLINISITINDRFRRVLFKKNSWCEKNKIHDCKDEHVNDFVANLECIIEMYLGVDYDRFVWESFHVNDNKSVSMESKPKFKSPAKLLRLYKKNNIIKDITKKIKSEQLEYHNVEDLNFVELAYNYYYKNLVTSDKQLTLLIIECWEKKCSIDDIVCVIIKDSIILKSLKNSNTVSHTEIETTFYVTDFGVGYNDQCSTEDYDINESVGYLGNMTIKWL
jgi:hypothetical protein